MKNLTKKTLAIILSMVMIIPLMSPVFAATYPSYTGSSRSIVDGLNALGIDSSYENRAKIAESNGINNYSGTASQNNYLLELLRQGDLIIPGASNNNHSIDDVNNAFYPTCAFYHTSIVDALTSIGADPSFSNRARIAAANEIINYVGSAQQNSMMLSALKSGTLKNPDAVVSDKVINEEISSSIYVESNHEISEYEESYNPSVSGDTPKEENYVESNYEISEYEESYNPSASGDTPKEENSVIIIEPETGSVTDMVAENDNFDFYPPCAGYHTSIIDALTSIGADPSFSNRARIAAANEIMNYVGSAQQNLMMLSALKSGTLKNPEVSISDNASKEEIVSSKYDNNHYDNLISDESYNSPISSVDATENEEEFICYDYEDCTADDSKIYIIAKDKAPIRTKASNSGEIVSRAKEGQLISVKRVFWTWKLTRWCELNVSDTDQKYYIYLGNVEEHDDSSHSFVNALTTGTGSVDFCSICGVSKATLAEKSTVCDLTCVLEQAVFGSFSKQSASFGSVLAQIIVGEIPGIGTLADARDIVGDIMNGAPVWVIAADCAALIPLVGMLKYADELTIITKNSDELVQASAKATPDLAKKIDNVFNGGYNIKIAGKGSTGRVIPNDIVEKMAMENTLNNPFNPGEGNTVTKIIDSLDRNENWEGWQKWAVSYNVDNFRVGTAEDFAKGENLKNLTRKIEIHFNYDPINNVFDDFKFKDN